MGHSSLKSAAWVLAIALTATSALAQETTASATEGYRSGSYPETYGSDTFYPATELRSLPGARAAAVAARAQLRRAESDLNNAVNDLKRQFRKSSELREALAEEKEAFDALNRARASATAHLRNDESYLAALELRQQMSDRIERERELTHPRLEQVLGMATLKLSYAATASAMEAAAVSANSDVQRARQRLVEAAARVSELREQFDETVRSSPEVLAARKAVGDGRIALQVADAAYIEAKKVAHVAMDYAYFTAARKYSPYYSPYGYNGYYGYGSYYGGGYGYPVYSLGYPVNWWQTGKHRRGR